MEKQNNLKKYFGPTALIVVVFVITAGLIQLVGIGIDYLRVIWNIPEQGASIETTSTTTSQPVPITEPIINPSIIEGEVGSSTDANSAFLSSQKINVYPNGLVTPPTLIEACENKGDGVINQIECNKEIAKITRVFEVKETPTEGWLYIKAGVNDDNTIVPLQPPYDALWFFIDNGKYSGHLLFSDAISSRISTDGSTELLFNLESLTVVDLPYSESKPLNKENLNVIEALTVGEHYIAAFVSSLNRGEIQTLEIGFRDGDISILK